MVDRAAIEAYLENTLDDATIPELPHHYRGKVRDNYDLPDGHRIVIATDRLSAFDRILAAIPLKGQVLNEIAGFWFEATQDICPNHVIEHPDPNVLVCQRLAILPVEIVVRDYLTGTTATSIWPAYRAGRRVIYGITFPDGLRENQKLPHPIVTPTTKAPAGGHDEPLTAAEVTGRGLLAAEEWGRICEAALALFERGQKIARERGLILADSKYEFGIDPSGRIILADEIHTPDSSRYWRAANYPQRFAAGEPPESLDKDFVRRWVAARCDPYRDPLPPIPRDIVAEAARIYVDVFETITGRAFRLPDPRIPVLARIRASLAPYF